MRQRFFLWLAIGVWLLAAASVGSAETLRIVTYNVDADTGSPDSGPGLTTVLQAIGSDHLQGNTQPIDVLALEEMTATTTPSYIVGQLNAIYGAGTYAYDPTSDPTTGGTGGGPSGLIYNTHTVKDVGAVAIGSVSGSGAGGHRCATRFNRSAPVPPPSSTCT